MDPAVFVYIRASRPSTRWRSSVTSCCSAMIASRVARLAWSKSNPGSIVPLCHNSAPTASIFQPGGGLRQIRLTKSEQLRRRRFGCRRGGCVAASIGCSFPGVGFLFQNHYHRSTGAPSCRFRTLTRRPPSVDSGLGIRPSTLVFQIHGRDASLDGGVSISQRSERDLRYADHSPKFWACPLRSSQMCKNAAA